MNTVKIEKDAHNGEINIIRIEDGEIIAACAEIKKSSPFYKGAKYSVMIIGGKHHGKRTSARTMAELKIKAKEIEAIYA